MKSVSDIYDDYQTLKMISPKLSIEYNTMTIPVEHHRHEFFEMVLVVKGPLRHHHPRGVTVHERGDVFVINMEETHWYDYSENQDVAFYNILINPPTFYEMLNSLQEGDSFDTTAIFSGFVLHTNGFPVLKLEGHDLESVESMCGDILFECEHETVGTALIGQSLLTAMLVLICRRWEQEYGDVGTAYTPRGRMVMQAVSYIQQNFAQRISIDELAHGFFVSSDHFRKAFKQLIGVSPLKYINNLRIQYSCELMENPTLSIAAVAQQSGFNDLNHFTRVFVGINGVTPSTYRKHRTQMLASQKKDGPPEK